MLSSSSEVQPTLMESVPDNHEQSNFDPLGGSRRAGQFYDSEKMR